MELANQMPEDDELLTIEEAAPILKVTHQELRMMLRYNQIPSIRLSRTKWRIKKSVLNAIITGEINLRDREYGKRDRRYGRTDL